MRAYADLDTRSALGAGWRVLRRHLRYASFNPRKLLWIARRAWQIVSGGELSGVLERHRLIEDFYRDYPAWVQTTERTAKGRMAHYLQEVARWAARPRFSVLMPVYQPSLTLLRESVQAVLDQSYADWELCIVDDQSASGGHIEWLNMLAAHEPRVRFSRRAHNGGIAAATNTALAAASGEFCVFLDQDDLLGNDALLEFAVRAVERPQAQIIYADEDRIDPAGVRSRPFFKPDWDPEWLRTTNYVLHPVAIRTSLLRSVGGLRTGLDGVQDWDLLLRLAEVTPAEHFEHIPRILYHWREHAGSTAAGIYEKQGIVALQERALRHSLLRRGEQAEVETTAGGFRIAYALPSPRPLASIVIPTRDRADLLRRCIDGLDKRTRYADWQAIVIDNGSTDAAARRLLGTLQRDRRFVVLRDERNFNYSALCNRGVAEASGEVVVLLNNDIEPIGAQWLEELVSHAIRPGIGMVSALLYYPNHTIQHAGVVLGLNGIADRPYIGYPRGFRGVDGRLGAVHSVTAMITACAAVRRETYLRAGGMDEALPVACNDLDLCLRVRKLGLRNIVTPFAELVHSESASRGYHYDTAYGRQETLDEAHFLDRYAGELARDPSYNINLTRKGAAFALAHASPETTLP